MKMTVGLPTRELERVFALDNGFLIGRMHGLESDALLEYRGAKNRVSGVSDHILTYLKQTPGFYAREHECEEILEVWCRIYLASLRDCDILVTLGIERYNPLVEGYYDELYTWSCTQLHAWLPFLEGKRVLVISPFVKTIRRQYETRDFAKVFEQFGRHQGRPPVQYPNFELLTVQSPNTVTGNEPFPHNNWLESFEALKQEVSSLDFDIAVAGCGGYGMPIVHYVKTLGRGGIQAGSYAQVMFGIKGHRWRNQGWWNDQWVYPSPEETPASYKKIEDGGYWKP